MDHFGIGAAMRGLVRAYQTASRRTGRTASLVASVKDGDLIVFADAKEARRVEGMLRERGVQASCVVVNVHDPADVLRRGLRRKAGNRAIFDHGFVEAYYAQAVEGAFNDIAALQRDLSPSTPQDYPETELSYFEQVRWR
jgi:hypothetical protein